MSEILRTTQDTVTIGSDDGSMADLPIASISFPGPVVGDQVCVYKNNDAFMVSRAAPTAESSDTNDQDRRKVNKVAYVLLTFFLGGLGIHRFMRGQVGLGILMLFFGWVTLGIWWLVDFVISLVKLPAYPGDDFIFTADGRFAK